MRYLRTGNKYRRLVSKIKLKGKKSEVFFEKLSFRRAFYAH